MKRIAMIPLAFLLLLLPAAPSFAKHGGKDKVRNYVEADFRCGTDMQHAARKLENSSWATFKRAKRMNDYPTRGERRALRNLKRLAIEARQFRIATHEYNRLRPMVADFRDLNHAYHKAARKFHKLDVNRKTRREFRRTTRVMNRIENRFEPVLARIERREHRRHARQDRHDRYARSDRRDRHDRHASAQWSWRTNGWR